MAKERFTVSSDNAFTTGATHADLDLERDDDVSVSDTTNKDLERFVFLLDLDDTITHTTKHLKEFEESEIEFVPGSLELIAHIHSRGAKIAIVSHSSYKTIYAKAALGKLAEMRVANIPFISLYEATIKALETSATIEMSSDKAIVVFNGDPSKNFHVNYNNQNISDVTKAQIALTLVGNSRIKEELIEIIGKGVSPIMGLAALEQLGIAVDDCKEMSICTIGDAITDIKHAKILRENCGFKEAFGFWLHGYQEKLLFQYHAIYSHNLPGAIQVAWAEDLVNLRDNSVYVVHAGMMMTRFHAEEWREISTQSKNTWEEIFFKTQERANNERRANAAITRNTFTGAVPYAAASEVLGEEREEREETTTSRVDDRAYSAEIPVPQKFPRSNIPFFDYEREESSYHDPSRLPSDPEILRELGEALSSEVRESSLAAAQAQETLHIQRLPHLGRLNPEALEFGEMVSSAEEKLRVAAQAALERDITEALLGIRKTPEWNANEMSAQEALRQVAQAAKAALERDITEGLLGIRKTPERNENEMLAQEEALRLATGVIGERGANAATHNEESITIPMVARYSACSEPPISGCGRASESLSNNRRAANRATHVDPTGGDDERGGSRSKHEKSSIDWTWREQASFMSGLSLETFYDDSVIFSPGTQDRSLSQTPQRGSQELVSSRTPQPIEKTPSAASAEGLVDQTSQRLNRGRDNAITPESRQQRRRTPIPFHRRESWAMQVTEERLSPSHKDISPNQ